MRSDPDQRPNKQVVCEEQFPSPALCVSTATSAQRQERLASGGPFVLAQSDCNYGMCVSPVRAFPVLNAALLLWNQLLSDVVGSACDCYPWLLQKPSIHPAVSSGG